MSREIKFRAWDTENKIWTFATIGDLICGACKPDGDKPLSGAKQIWEQYTGLKDKNGIEIYEGDIVKFEGSSFVIGWNIKYARFGFEPIGDDSMSSPITGLSMRECKVIGNIHENADLVGGNKDE